MKNSIFLNVWVKMNRFQEYEPLQETCQKLLSKKVTENNYFL